MRMQFFVSILGLLTCASWCNAQRMSPAELLNDITWQSRLGASIPLDLAFRDETDREVILRDYFHARPVVMALVYYECPMLCTQVLNGLVEALARLPFEPGRDFEVVVVSISETETPALAADKKLNYVTQFGRANTWEGWHFLTGEARSIETLADAVGYRFRYDPDTGQYVHPSGIMVLTPKGNISRYLYGISYAARDVRLSLVDAGASRIGSAMDQLLLLCFTYDPATGKYSMAVLTAVRLGGIATVIAMTGLIAAAIVRERRRRRLKFVE